MMIWYDNDSDDDLKESVMRRVERQTTLNRAEEQLPFMYVQLPSWDNGGTEELASMRLYQFSALSLIDNVATNVGLVSTSSTALSSTRYSSRGGGMWTCIPPVSVSESSTYSW